MSSQPAQTAAVDLGLPFPKELQPYRDGVARISQQPSAASSPSSIRPKSGPKAEPAPVGKDGNQKKKWAMIAGVVGGLVILAVVVALAVTLADKNRGSESGTDDEERKRRREAKVEKQERDENEEKDKATVFSESLKEFLRPQNVVASPMPAKETNPFAGAAPLSPM